MTTVKLINGIRKAGHADLKGKCLWNDVFASKCSSETCIWMYVASRKAKDIVLDIKQGMLRLRKAMDLLQKGRRKAQKAKWTGDQETYYKESYKDATASVQAFQTVVKNDSIYGILQLMEPAMKKLKEMSACCTSCPIT